MNELEKEIRFKFTTWSKKLDRNVRIAVTNMNEMNDRSMKLDRNVRIGVRN